MQTKRVVVDLFSGLMIPIMFFPEWAASLLSYLPFQAISYVPAMIFTGGITGTEAFEAIGIQFIWFIILALPIQFLWVKAKKSLIIQGG
jgi:ABC-2 type transport system permease protein